MKVVEILTFIARLSCVVVMISSILMFIYSAWLLRSLNEEKAAYDKKIGVVGDLEGIETTVFNEPEQPEKSGLLNCLEPIGTEAVETTEEIIEETTKPEEFIVKTYFDVPLERDLQDHIFAVCEASDFDPAILMAMIDRETDFRPQLIGDNGNSYGLLQVSLKWHGWRMEKYGCKDLLNPYDNVLVAMDFINELRGRKEAKQYGLEWVLMAYNGGATYANHMWGEGRVSDYARYVIERSTEFEMYEIRVAVEK